MTFWCGAREKYINSYIITKELENPKNHPKIHLSTRLEKSKSGVAFRISGVALKGGRKVWR